MPTSRERGSVKSKCFRVGVGIMLLVLAGCAVGKDLPNSTRTGRIQEVKITFLNPGGNPAVSVGDEVRWFNADPRPLTITFTNLSEDRVSCQKNFKSGSSGSRGAPQITATLGRHEYASLCFRAPGLYAYDANLGYRGFLSAFLSSKPVSNGTPWTAKVIVETPPRDGALTSRRWIVRRITRSLTRSRSRRIERSSATNTISVLQVRRWSTDNWRLSAEGVTNLWFWIRPDKGEKPCCASITSLALK